MASLSIKSQIEDFVTKKRGLIAKWGIGAAIFLWLLNTCGEQREARNIELKGTGMLEAKGFYKVYPGAGTDWYYMRDDPQYGPDDYRAFFGSLRFYQSFFVPEMRKRGLSESEIAHIPDWEWTHLWRLDAKERGDELKRLAIEYD